jgi:adenylate cyclase
VEQLTELKQWDDKLMAVCVSQFSELLRGLLRQHGGYEVECEGGNMLSAFADPVAAVRWALAVQMGLLSMRWPQRLMLHRAAAEQYDPDTQKTVFIGLRAGIGMCTGNAEVMQPCPRTGRAEYFGPLMNHAARVAYAASGGQVRRRTPVLVNCQFTTVAFA